jgi:tetratricopeptide (TPR) repeat protein
MRAFVLTDESLTRHAGRFVWLELDTEKAVNAAARQKLGVVALPTYFVLDPADEHVALRWVGGATVPQLHRLLEDGAAAVSGRQVAEGTDGALGRADRLYARADYAGAAQAFQEALEAAPADWAPYARVVESLLFALYRTGDHATAAGVAREAFPRLSGTPSAANVALSGLGAALSLPDSLPERAGLISVMEEAARQVIADTASGVAADDRSGVYIGLLEARQDAKDEAGARQVAEAWAAFLEREAARARTPEERTVFDSHRLSAYLELGEPQRAIPMLEAAERDLPDDYNPASRLAIAYRALKRWDDALAASDRALAKVYGPRRLSLLSVRADIHRGRGDLDAARETLERAIAEAESLPEGQRSEWRLKALRDKLEAME